jgi:2-polyprenyl-6-methoxyphenol hydroxylase-like FAD-dependent oxidoreductase
LADGTSITGKLVVGADGSGSWTRRFLLPETGKLYRLPVLFIGVIVSLTPEQYAPIQEIDPFMFQGTCAKSGTYMYMNVLSTPVTNESGKTDKPYYTAQCSISWEPHYEGEEVPATSNLRLKRMRELCSDMAPAISNMINEIPDGVEAIEVKLQDWPCLEWPNHDGRITLAGDAAHAMTMYRGEAANHGIADAALLFPKLVAAKEGGVGRREAVEEYETELRLRAHNAVLMSRQACMDAHNLAELKDDSPVLSLN